jgi:hypothetical protein
VVSNRWQFRQWRISEWDDPIQYAADALVEFMSVG